MAQFPTPFGGKLFIVYSYMQKLHKSVAFQICSVWKCLWVSETIVYLICDVFADQLENTHRILQRHLRRVKQNSCAVPLFCASIHYSPTVCNCRAD